MCVCGVWQAIDMTRAVGQQISETPTGAAAIVTPGFEALRATILGSGAAQPPKPQTQPQPQPHAAAVAAGVTVAMYSEACKADHPSQQVTAGMCTPGIPHMQLPSAPAMQPQPVTAQAWQQPQGGQLPASAASPGPTAGIPQVRHASCVLLYHEDTSSLYAFGHL